MARRRKGYVYLIRSANGLTKIGHTVNIVQRFKSLDGESPVELKLVGYMESSLLWDLERELHRTFHDKRIRGEWFKLSLEDIDCIKERRDFVEARIFCYNGEYCIIAVGLIKMILKEGVNSFIV